MKKSSTYILKGILKLSWKSLHKNKGRSFLTSLGIIIGAATIVLVVEMGAGASAKIEEQYSNMSVTTILVNAPSTADGQASKLSIDDVDDLLESQYISQAVPQLTGKVESSGGGNSYQASILGSLPELKELAALEINKGRFFTQEEENEHLKVAILGATVVEELYGDRNADVVGQTINVGKKQFEIVGTVNYKGGSIGPVTIDDSIMMPYSSAYRYVLGKSGKFNLNLQASDVDVIDLAMDDASKILRNLHNIRLGMPEDFRLRDMGANVQSAQESARTMSLLLGSVGFIVLLVGGIGIMNVMQIIVKERTKEIGIRKAIGAKRIHIMLQFLVEAVILSGFGAIVGLILATLIYYGLDNYGLDIEFIWWSYLLSFVFTMGIGVFFGYYPAVQASKLKPIDTLRYE